MFLSFKINKFLMSNLRMFVCSLFFMGCLSVCLSVCLYICIILCLYSNFSFLKRIYRVFQYTNLQSDSGEGILCQIVVPLSCKSFCCELTILFFFQYQDNRRPALHQEQQHQQQQQQHPHQQEHDQQPHHNNLLQQQTADACQVQDVQ